MKRTFSLLMLSFSILLFSQEKEKFGIHSQIRVENLTCEKDATTKLVVFEVWYEDAWKELLNGEMSKCENNLKLPILQKDRKFKITVSAKGYETKKLEFNVKAGTKGTVEVPEIILKKKVKTPKK